MARFIIDIGDKSFDSMEEEQARQFIQSYVLPTMMTTFNTCRSVVPPDEVPKGGEIGCSATTAGGGSVTCGGSIRW